MNVRNLNYRVTPDGLAIALDMLTLPETPETPHIRVQVRRGETVVHSTLVRPSRAADAFAHPFAYGPPETGTSDTARLLASAHPPYNR